MYPHLYPAQLQYNCCPMTYRYFLPMYNSHLHNSFMNKRPKEVNKEKRTIQPDMVEQAKYAEKLKEIETETPEVMTTLLNLGLSKEASRLFILRIIELANKP